MTASVTRLTLYALIGGLETDLRYFIQNYLLSQVPPSKLFPKDVLERAKSRMRSNLDTTVNDAESSDVLDFIDFADSYQTLAKNRKLLDKDTSQYFQSLVPKFEIITPVRNRVMHSRPLEMSDLSNVVEVTDYILKRGKVQWPNLSVITKQLKNNPHYVLDIDLRLPEPPGVPHNLPLPDFDDTGFLGRKKKVKELIQACLGPYPVITIVGEGGQGKTALALKVAYDLLDKDDLPFDTIVWTSAKTSELTVGEIKRIEGALSDSLGLLSHATEQLAPPHQWEDPVDELLQYLKEFRVLLILDNLETVLDKRIRTFFEKLPTGSKVLVTSRIGVGAFDYPIRLSALSVGEAGHLLRAYSRFRDVTMLEKINQDTLTHYLNRMKCNPLFIKWFVNAVSTGQRPDAVLANPKLLLDYCMSNVYNHIGKPAKQLIAAMLSVPGPQTQSELSFLADFNVAQVQEALNELLVANMASIISHDRSGANETAFELNVLARLYLANYHKPTVDEGRLYTAKKMQLVASYEKALSETDPYEPRTIEIRTKSDLVVSRHLYDALKAIAKNDLPLAAEKIETAKQLDPGYFEVYRILAWLEINKGNNFGAREAFESAVELAPDYAPLRLLYGGCLLRSFNDCEKALEQYGIGQKIDGSSARFPLEMARVYLFTHKWAEARDLLDKLMQRTDLDRLFTRKVWDTHFQYYYRMADMSARNRDYVKAVECLNDLRNEYDKCPSDVIDQKMRIKLEKSAPIARWCANFFKGSDDGESVEELVNWYEETVSDSLRKSVDLLHGEEYEGTIDNIPKNKNFAFLQTEGGRQLFFHKFFLSNPEEWERMKEGDVVNFRIGQNEKGTCAVNVALK